MSLLLLLLLPSTARNITMARPWAAMLEKEKEGSEQEHLGLDACGAAPPAQDGKSHKKTQTSIVFPLLFCVF